MNRVLILDGNLRSTLAVVRSLGKTGAEIFVADEVTPMLASASRYCDESFLYPSPAGSPQEFLAVLQRKVTELGINMLIPVSEVSIYIILKNRDRFPGVVIPYPEYELFQEVSNKISLMQTAESLGIAIPETEYLNEIPDLNKLDTRIPYPVIIKPYRSRVEEGGRWHGTSVYLANNRDELINIFVEHPLLQRIPVMFQRFMPGHGQGVFVYVRPGYEPVFFAHRRIREKPPAGGVSVLSESIDTPPALRRCTEMLLRHYGWHGVAMVEYRVDDGGNACLMEINARFWGSLQLAIFAGCDFPRIMYEDIMEGRPPKEVDYERGIRCRWLLGDLDHLLLVLRSPRSGRGREYSFREKVTAILRFLLPGGRKVKYEINMPDDMKPFYVEVRKYVADLLRLDYGRHYNGSHGEGQ